MILFPITDEPQPQSAPNDPWKAVESAQKKEAASYFLITQPSHAALAGDLAAALRPELFGEIDETIARSIALHDAGWSMNDAEQIQRLRSNAKQKPSSFLDASPSEFLTAWTGSIETAERFAPIGGYLVSRHFERLSQASDSKDAQSLGSFREREKQRQARIRSTLLNSDEALDRLVDALQFCDLLSLYLCSGSRESVRFTQEKTIASRHGDEYRLDPSPFREPRQFSFSALRHPAGKGPGQSGATFYISL